MDVGMVFAMIFTIILILFLIVFGAQQITDFFCLSNEARTLKNIQDLENVVEELYQTAEGSTDTYTLSLPSDAKFCFVSPEDTEKRTYVALESWKDWKPDPTYKIVIEENGYSLWYKHCKGQSGYKIEKLRPRVDRQGSQNFCTRQNTKLYLENTGLWINISV